MPDAAGSLSDLETFAKAEEKRSQEFADAQNNKSKSYWYADKELAFKRDSMWDFFTQINANTLLSAGGVVSVKRAADTVAAFDRAYKFRRQGRLDNVPRQTCISNMDVYYWNTLADALKAMAEMTAPGG